MCCRGSLGLCLFNYSTNIIEFELILYAILQWDILNALLFISLLLYTGGIYD